jgi:hypothetical protein
VVKNTSSIGIIIACYPGDLIWAKGCIGSLRQARVEIPIVILFDGVAKNYSELDALLHLGLIERIIDRNTVRDPWLKANSFGWGFTKMIAFWESPWEKFIFLDADTAVSGDISSLFSDLDEVDFIIDQAESAPDDQGIKKWFFDPERVAIHYPSFEWRRYAANYYCTGVFAARRGAILLEEYKQAMEIHKKDPLLYRFGGEMGMLNLLIFFGHQKGVRRFFQRRIQMLTADHDDSYLSERLNEGRSWVFHYAGRKPLIHGAAFNQPMTQGRKYIAELIHTNLLREDCLFKLRYFFFRARKKIRFWYGIRV